MSQTLELHDAGATAEQVLAVQRVAAGYTRQSKAKADKSEASPQAQGEATERKARERGCSFKGHYRDIGVSGYNPNAKRKSFDRLMDDCRDGLIQEIVVFNVTRFSRREPKDMIPVVLELFSLGVTITSVAEGSFTPDNTMELMMLIWRLEASYQDSKNKSELVGGAKRKAKQFGGWTGGTPPYGMESYPVPETRVIDGKPVTITIRLLRPVPKNEDGTDQGSEVLRLVDRIFEHKDKPWDRKKNAHPASVNSCTTWLNSRSVETQHGGMWRVPTVKRLLSDPRLAGFAAETVYRTDSDGRPTRTVDGYRILRDEHGEPIIIGEALIPPARWFELQEWLSARGRGKGLTRGEYLLTAMVRLECECGRPMTGSPRIYKCCRPSGVVEPGKHEGGNSINQADVNDYVARKILDVILDAEGRPETLEIIAEATLRFGKLSENPETRGERASLVGERSAVTKSIERLYDDLNSGIYDGPIGRARFLDEKQQLENRLEAVGRRIIEVGGPDPHVLPVAEWGDADDEDPIGEDSWWGRATVADRRVLVKLFVDKIVVTKADYRGGTGRVCKVEERVTVTMASPESDEEEQAA
ncbi:recombinase family protein [Streptomyces scopuliridis]|uniref:recombinase family protein n=1 Tax=Streptomyces scopuliridis TaxID=452529 RepID=UPI0036AEBF80